MSPGTAPRIGGDALVFEFDDHWTRGHNDGRTDGWAHHGVAVTSEGTVLTFDEQRSEVHVIDASGSVVRSFAVNATEAHGMTVVGRGSAERLWICDNGSKQRRRADGSYAPSPKPLRGAVVEYALDGAERRRLPTPELDVYAGGDYCPSAIAVEQGGTGDIWVADCYGQSLVHRFDRSGRYRQTLDGTTGAGRFRHPHDLCLVERSGRTQLLVADRGNHRIQRYELDGTYAGSFGEQFLLSPGGLAPYGDYLLVAELHSRIAVVSPDDQLVTCLGAADEDAVGVPGWPNVLSPGGLTRPQLHDGEFHTPHGIATDPAGNIYVAEWLIGGRLVKLSPADPARG